MLKLKEIREGYLLDKEFVSQLVGLSTSEYESYENDYSGKKLKKNPKLLTKLTRILGYSPNDLFSKKLKEITKDARNLKYLNDLREFNEVLNNENRIQ